ncbi:SRPBCC family protein [Pedobacter xixiisoli]|uniref:Ligand-binding SRPBCC domain-containing protein n=1 Tax=Pedobacter xixiisoli TaxID=1476464 RepID=A0A285ZQI8_9SPHI|nr:SRPBCC family protein [Pedobacter xixiisoli]SOD11914.1 Ligand-binding SRPBCC domain-containing protein [Pedobacter xixiisoli]
MKKYELYRETELPITMLAAWDFFSNPTNLSKITPAEMDFKVVTSNLPQHIHNGLIIEYVVRPLAGVPLKWISQISSVNAPHSFVDEQLKGPYAYWHHEHTFEEKGGKVLMKDKVTYAVPFGVLGQLANKLVVRSKLEEIFNYRTKKILEFFKAD